MPRRAAPTRISHSRVRALLMANEDVGRMTVDVPVVVARALELFVEDLVLSGAVAAAEHGATTITPRLLADAVKAHPFFDFLTDLTAAAADAHAASGEGDEKKDAEGSGEEGGEGQAGAAGAAAAAVQPPGAGGKRQPKRKR